MASIPPHGKVCAACYGEGKRPAHYASADFGKKCPACHGTGRACPGGEVRAAFYADRLREDCLAPSPVYICQTCRTVVDPGEVTE